MSDRLKKKKEEEEEKNRKVVKYRFYTDFKRLKIEEWNERGTLPAATTGLPFAKGRYTCSGCV